MFLLCTCVYHLRVHACIFALTISNIQHPFIHKHTPTHPRTHTPICMHTYTNTHTHTHTYCKAPAPRVCISGASTHVCIYAYHHIFMHIQLETPAPCVYVSGASIHVCICTYHIYSYTYNSKPWCHVSILVKPVYMRAYVHTTYIQAHIHLETPAPCVYVSRASTNVCIYIYYVYSKTYIPRNYGAMCLC